MRSGCDTTTPCAHLLIWAKKTKSASGLPKTPANRDCALLARASWRSSQADVAFQCESRARQRRREPSVHSNVMDTLGFEPRAFRMQSGCDTTTPCARMPLSSAVKTIGSRQFRSAPTQLPPRRFCKSGRHSSTQASITKAAWTHWDLSPGPSACEADVIPLHHVPSKT